MNKHFKYQRSSLNIIILNVRRNVLFSTFMDIVLKLNYLPLNSNYNISVKFHTCIGQVVNSKVCIIATYILLPFVCLNFQMIIYVEKQNKKQVAVKQLAKHLVLFNKNAIGISFSECRLRSLQGNSSAMLVT